MSTLEPIESHFEDQEKLHEEAIADEKFKWLLRRINDAVEERLDDEDERIKLVLEISKILPDLAAKFTTTTGTDKMPLVDTELKVARFKNEDLCDTCATYVSDLDNLALAAMMNGTAAELREAHMKCRGRSDRWDADFNGEMHESMLRTSPMKSLARRQAINIIDKHGSSVPRILKEVPIGRLYGPRGSDRLWIGSSHGWKLGTDLTSHWERHDRDKVDGTPEVFFHEYGVVQGYKYDYQLEEEWSQIICQMACKWLADKNAIDAATAAAPFTIVGYGAYGTANKLMDSLNYLNRGRDGSEKGGLMSYLASGIVHDATEILGDLVQNEVGNWWVTGGQTAGVHALKLNSVVAAFQSVYSQTRNNGDGQILADWLWVLGNGRHRGYSCAQAAKTLCKGHQLHMQRAYITLADEKGGRLPLVELDVCIKIRDDIVSLVAVLEEVNFEREAGEDKCIEIVSGIGKTVAQAREDGVPPEVLLDAARVGFDIGFRREGFWDMIIGSIYYKPGHSDLDTSATREFTW
ncbi:hypothetical protein TWF694_000418 [Orbilia ellipsospora]|uniref:Uncharacterized protein n=1 Tax=Orbilia ellipsospora TaxID=2528407 RepID=A0AAV9XQA5_9PEZI